MNKRKYYPKKDEDGRYFWQSAYAEACAKHYIIPSYIYDILYGYRSKDRSYLRKTFDTYDEAVRQFDKALDLIKKGYEEYSN
jgi:hypothetical protein